MAKQTIFVLNSRLKIREAFRKIRRQSEKLCQSLAVDDYMSYIASETLPVKWHLAHTTWYAENVLMEPYAETYEPFHSGFDEMFSQHFEHESTAARGLLIGNLSRPTVDEVYEYRAAVDEAVDELIDDAIDDIWPQLSQKVYLVLEHELMHQEQMMAHIQQIFARNPMQPIYRACAVPTYNAMVRMIGAGRANQLQRQAGVSMNVVSEFKR